MQTSPFAVGHQSGTSHSPSRDGLLQRIQRFVQETSAASHPEFLVAAYGRFLGWPFDEANYSRDLTALFRGVTREQLLEALVSGTALVPSGSVAKRRQPRTSPAELAKGYGGLEQYQDIWVKGKLLHRGLRECEDRFGIIRNFCSQFKRPFTILDIGSNLGYFSLRLTETFDCTSLACEGVYGDWIEDVLHANGNKRVILARKMMSLRNLRALAEVEHFDVVLGLSVIHHLDGGFDESLEVLRSLGEHLILELPVEPNACGQAVVKDALNFSLPDDAVILGYGQSHLANCLRPILSLSRPKPQIRKAYLGSPRSDLKLSIRSDFERKTVEFHHKREQREWTRGINLQTYLWLNGSYPAKAEIASMLKAEGRPEKPHRDIQPWNVVLQGDGVTIIDADDPNHLRTYDDASNFLRLIRLLEAEEERYGVGEKTEGVTEKNFETEPLNSAPVIAIDARTFDVAESVARGIGHYALNHLLAVGQLKPEWNFVLLNSNGRPNAALERLLQLKNFRVGSIAEAEKIQASIYHIPDPLTLPHSMVSPMQLFPGRVQSAVFYDLTPLKFYAKEFPNLDLGMYRQRLDELLKGNAHLLAISEFTRKDLLGSTGVPENRVTTILAGLNRSPEGSARTIEGSQIRRTYGITGPFFLHVGALDAHKNFQAVLNAFNRLPRGLAQLVVVGQKVGPLKAIAEQCTRLKQPGILFPGFVPREELEALYKEAAATLILSRYEGFGLPVLEAMAQGCPVIASNATSLPEVCGDAALQFAPSDIAGVAEAMHSLLADSSKRETLRLLGRAQAAKFSWEQSAKRTVDIWEKLLAGQDGGLVSEPARAEVAQPVRPVTEPNAVGGLKVCWEGAFHDNGSLAHVNRSITAQLEGAGVKVQRKTSGTNGTDSAVDIVIRHSWPPNWTRPSGGKLVVMQPWEFGSLPKEWVSAAEQVDQVWVYTEHVRNVYIHSGVAESKVKVVPCGIDPERFHPNVAPLALPTRKKFKFLFVGGTIYRKGPDLLLAAYLNAFSGSDDVCLVIKDFGGASCYKGQTLETEIRKAQTRPNAPEILYITQELAAEELPRLYAACDCLVHPYRGEGFGLPVLEAMACGLPVIASGGGATDDFAREDLVYRLRSQRRTIGRSVSGMELADNGWFLEPSLSDLCTRLSEVFENQKVARSRGLASSEFVRHEWTWKRAAEIANKYLCDLQTSPEVAVPAQSVRMVQGSVSQIGSLEAARGLFSAGRLEEAWNSALEAVSLRPFHPEGYLLLSEIAAKTADVARAQECLERASKLVPQWKTPKKALKKLHGRKGAPKINLPGLPIAPAKPRITVCLITKNEEQFLAQCLASVKEIAYQIVIADTGSTDRTVEIARGFGAEVHSFRWCDDFSAARNAALEHARGDWVLVLDADEELPSDQHEILLKELENTEAIGYRLPLVNQGSDNHPTYVPRLFRNAPGAHFQCRVHEQVFPSLLPLAGKLNLELPFSRATLLHHGYTKHLIASRDKVGRNLRLLKVAAEEHPQDVNIAMNLALELCRSGEEARGVRQYREAFRLLTLKANSTSPELLEMLFDQYITALSNQGLKEEILEVFNSEVARHCGLSASLHFTAGFAHLEKGEFKAAAEHFRKCIAKRNETALWRVNPEVLTAAPHHCLARCLAKLGDPKGAEEAYRKALSENGNIERIKMDFAAFLAETGSPVDALTLLYEVVSENAVNSAAWLLGGKISTQRSELLEFACDWTKEAVSNLPDVPEIVAMRGEFLLLAQAPEEALLLLRYGTLHEPSDKASLLACQLAVDEPLAAVSPEEQSVVSFEFVQLYRRLLNVNATGLVRRLNERLGQLEIVLPTAAKMLQAAITEADAVVAA